MTSAQTEGSTRQQPLRLWPGVVIVALMWGGKLLLPLFGSVAGAIGAMGVLVWGLATLVWWAFFSRASRLERWGGAVLMIAAVVATRSLVDESLATAGMGFTFFMQIISVLSLALVAWAVVRSRLPSSVRRVGMVAVVVLACGVWTLVRLDGITGDGAIDFSWRWAETHEQRLLAETGGVPVSVASASMPSAAVEETGAEWPGFRGRDRDGIIHGVRIETDWSESPPEELWRQPIGPGWSSFAVQGDLIYTQEQRGDDEVVSSYSAATGELVWRHADTARFWESHAGAGPRATPTVSGGRVYSFGATGILNALDAGDGTLVWSRDTVSDTAAKVPEWGFSNSPLVVDDVVIVHAGKLVAYDLATGDPRWFGPDRGGSYSSPHLVKLDGVIQVLMSSGAGATGVATGDGAVLWEHPWAGNIVQPALAANGDLLISAGGLTGGLGIRRLTVARVGGLTENAELSGSPGWTIEEGWTSIGLKPNFSDFVVHEGHAYGFDGNILSCIDLEDGERQWKGGRYGSGQLVLLADQDLLVVVSEKGELALVAATPDEFSELERFPAVEGKTWNHPVLVGDLLLVRNGQEMVALRLSLAQSS